MLAGDGWLRHLLSKLCQFVRTSKLQLACGCRIICNCSFIILTYLLYHFIWHDIKTVLSLLLYFLTHSSSHSAHPTFKLILDHAHLWFTEPSHYFGPFLDFLFSTIFILTAAGENPKAGSHRHRAPSPTPGRHQPRWSWPNCRRSSLHRGSGKDFQKGPHMPHIQNVPLGRELWNWPNPEHVT